MQIVDWYWYHYVYLLMYQILINTFADTMCNHVNVSERVLFLTLPPPLPIHRHATHYRRSATNRLACVYMLR